VSPTAGGNHGGESEDRYDATLRFTVARLGPVVTTAPGMSVLAVISEPGAGWMKPMGSAPTGPQQTRRRADTAAGRRNAAAVRMGATSV
jgi:hypothetical protein